MRRGYVTECLRSNSRRSLLLARARARRPSLPSPLSGPTAFDSANNDRSVYTSISAGSLDCRRRLAHTTAPGVGTTESGSGTRNTRTLFATQVYTMLQTARVYASKKARRDAFFPTTTSTRVRHPALIVSRARPRAHPERIVVPNYVIVQAV